MWDLFTYRPLLEPISNHDIFTYKDVIDLFCILPYVTRLKESNIGLQVVRSRMIFLRDARHHTIQEHPPITCRAHWCVCACDLVVVGSTRDKSNLDWLDISKSWNEEIIHWQPNDNGKEKSCIRLLRKRSAPGPSYQLQLPDHQSASCAITLCPAAQLQPSLGS